MTKRFILALLLSGSPLWGTTYYVDNCVIVGSDSNNGTSTSTPWLTIAHVNGRTFSPGDSVLFERTCTWSEQLHPPSSGSVGLPIAFGAYGSGALPIITGGNARVFAVYASAISYVTFQDLAIIGSTGFGIDVNNSGHVNLLRVLAHNNASSGICFENGSHHCSVVGGASYSNGGAGDQNGIGIGGTGNGTSYITISGMDLYSNANDNIQISQTDTNQYADHVTVTQCRIHDSAAAGMEVDYSHTNILIAHNLFYKNTTYGLGVDTGVGGTGSTFAYNNTFYGNGGVGGYAEGLSGNFGSGSSFIFKNNILMNGTGSEFQTIGATSGFVSDFNDIYNSDSYIFNNILFNYNGTFYNTAGWNTHSGQDANSISSNPSLTNASSSVFWLLPGSPAIDRGINLGSPYNIGLLPGSIWPNSVVTGDQNAYGSGWEIGAFIYVPVAPLPPTNVHATVH